LNVSIIDDEFKMNLTVPRRVEGWVGLTSKAMTMMSCPVRSYLLPQDDVNAMRQALVITPTMFMKRKMAYHIPARTNPIHPNHWKV